MRNKNTVSFKSIFVFLLFNLFFAINAKSQPQHFNYDTQGSSNSFPFNIALGKQIQLLYLPGDFNQPSPAPAGNITALYFKMYANLGPYNYTNLVIKMGQSSITEFAPGGWYTGQLDTVYSNASVSLSGTALQWLMITLDRPFNYDPTQSLILDIQQCGAGGASGFSSCYTSLVGFRRNTSLVGSSCPFPWGNQNTYIHHVGISISTVGIGSNNLEIPSEYKLEQNFPNPFNPSTNIKFEIREKGFVDLKIYNSLGKEVAALVNEVREAGKYSVDFNAELLSNGTYFYTLRVNDFIQTKKMILLK